MIRVLICDDQNIVSTGLNAILSTAVDIEVIGIADDGAEAVEKVSELKPDLVLMDLKMPIMNGIQATRIIHEKHPLIKVLILTTYDDDAWLFDAIHGGASGYLLKDTPREHLITAIRETMAGKTHIDPSVAGKLFQHINRRQSSRPVTTDSTLTDSLSERERGVLRLLAQGLNNHTIAEQLYLSEGTVRNYVSNIFTKLGVSDRTQAAVIALRYGIAGD